MKHRDFLGALGYLVICIAALLGAIIIIYAKS